MDQSIITTSGEKVDSGISTGNVITQTGDTPVDVNNMNTTTTTESMKATTGPVKSVVPEITSVNIRTIHGPLHELNYFTLDFSSNGLVAFSCHNQIIIAESRDGCQKVIQTLDRHKDPVTKIKWPHGPQMRLASADSKGHIIIWDVMRSATSTFIPFTESKSIDVTKTSPVVSLEFVTLDLPSPVAAFSSIVKTSCQKVTSDQYLMVLYGNNQLVIYDSESGDVIFKRALFNVTGSSKTSSLNQIKLGNMSLDPFSKRSLVFPLGPVFPSHIQCSFLKIDDFLSSNPNLNMSKYQIYVTDMIQSSSTSSSPDLKLAMKCFTGGNLFGTSSTSGRNSTQLLESPSGDDDPNNNPNAFMIEIKQVIYSKSKRHQVLVASTRVITIIDLKINQILVRIPLERSSSNLIDIYSCRLRHVIYTLHKSGSVSVRILNKKIKYDDLLETDIMDLSYESLVSSDNCLPKNSRDISIVGFGVNPMDETNLCILLSNGKIVFKCLENTIPTDPNVMKLKTISHLIPMSIYYEPVISEKIKGSFILKEIKSITSLSKPTLIKSCPPVTKSNWSQHKPLLAVGDMSGSIQIFDLNSGILEQEFTSIHGSQVRGIEWTGLRSFLSFSYPPLMPSIIASDTIRTSNELYLTDLDTKETIEVRKDKNIDSSPIHSIRVSHLKQYFVISFRDEPFEIWSLKNLKINLIKIMPRKFSTISVIEWSPINSTSGMKSRKSSLVSSDDHQVTSVDDKNTSSGDKMIQSVDVTEFTRENLVVSDPISCDLYHFSVNSPSDVKEMSCIHGDNLHGALQSISWKGDQVILGFADGNLLFWDLKIKSSTSKFTTRDAVKKIKFGPGRGNPNFVVLYQHHSVELWDLSTLKIISELRPSKDSSKDFYPHKILDIDWIGSDRPVLLTSDGLIFITDLSLLKYSSSLTFLKESDVTGVDLTRVNLNMMRDIPKFKMITNYIHGYMDGDGIKSAQHLIQRCLESSLLSGDVVQYDFWSLVYHHFMTGHQSDDGDMCESVDYSRETTSDESHEYQLDDYYEEYLDAESFRKLQKEKVSLYESCRKSFSSSSSSSTSVNNGQHQKNNSLCIEYHLILGHHQRAVQLLLESDPTSKSDFFNDSLKACLISAVNSFNQLKLKYESLASDGEKRKQHKKSLSEDESSQKDEAKRPSDHELDTFDPVIKLAAASLIASGAVEEGVQLLLLIGKVADACRYLQSNGSFKKSLWIAKTSESVASDVKIFDEILKRYLDHLVQKDQMNDYSHELLTLVSSKNVDRILGFLVNRNDLQTAALFARISEAIGLLSPGLSFSSSPSTSKSKDDADQPSSSPSDDRMKSTTPEPNVNGTLEFIYEKYADLLDKHSLDFLAFEYRKRISLREAY